MNKMTILAVDDWMVMYVNGIDKYQGHDIPLHEISKHTPIETLEIRYIESYDGYDYIDKYGRFPNTLDKFLSIEGA